MRLCGSLLLLGLVACSSPGGLATPSQPPPTQTATGISIPTAPPPTVTPVPPSATPLPPVITASTVSDLSVALIFAEGIVRSLAFSPDARVLAAAEGDPAASIGTITLYEAATGSRLGTLEGHTSGVWGLAFSPDGRYLATAGRDHTAKIWDWLGGTLVHSLDFPNEVVSVAFSPDSRTLAVGGVDEPPGSPLGDATIWTYAVDTWEPQLELAEFWNIPDIVFSPNGSLIIGGGTSRNARVWRTIDGAQQFVLYHPGQVGSLAVSPDGSTVATALCEASNSSSQCIRGGVWLWSLSTGRLLETISDFPVAVAQVAYSIDGTLLFAALPDGELRAYSTSDYSQLFTGPVPPSSFTRPIHDLSISADGRFLATGGSGSIAVWSIGG